MQPIVSCPECGRKLKVAPASLGRRVKCTCGAIFIAPADAAGPPPEPIAVRFEDDAPPRGRASDADWVESAARPKPVAAAPPPEPAPTGSPVLTAFVAFVVLAYAGVLVPTYLGLLDPYLPEPPRRAGNVAPPPRAPQMPRQFQPPADDDQR